MSQLTSVLREIRGLNSDRARDRLPDGAVWEISDWVPETLQAGARMRGAWTWRSAVLPNEPDGMIYAPYREAARLLVANGTSLHEIPITGTPAANLVTSIPVTRQDPVFFTQKVIVPAANGTSAMRYVPFTGTAADAPGTAPTARYATVWKGRLVVANTAADPSRVYYSQVGDPATWVVEASESTAYDITGLAQQRNQILVFHSGSVTRIRGTTPAHPLASVPEGDLIIDSLFDRAGCYDARSIAYWNENILFCDARGIFLTDGAAVRNLCLQGGVINLWLEMWERALTPGGTKVPPSTVAGVIHRDYYIVTVRHVGLEPITFVVEIPSRRFFLFKNIDAGTFAFALGQRERVFGTDMASKRVTDLSPAFDPDPTVLQIDADGSPVLPVIRTGWNRLSKNGNYKRVIDLHLSYEAHRDTDDEVLRLTYLNAPNNATPQTLGEFRTRNVYKPKKLAVRRRLPGVAFGLEQLLPTKDSRLYDMSILAFPEEETHL